MSEDLDQRDHICSADCPVCGPACKSSELADGSFPEQDKIALWAAIEQAAESIVITDTSGCIRYVNPAFSRITGYAREEVMGKNSRILKSGRQDPAFYQKMWSTILAGEVWRGEFVNRRKDGTLYNEEGTITPLIDQSGGITGFIATKNDVTARKAAEQSQKFFASIVENSEDAIIGSSLDGGILSWNAAASRLFGYTREEILGKPVYVLTTPDDLVRFVKDNERLKRGETIPAYDTIIVTRAGRHLDASISLSPVRDVNDEITAVASIIRDISARKQAEQARALLASVVESSSDAILAVAIDKTILSWNQGAERVYGYRAEEVLGKPASMLVPEGFQGQHDEMFARIAGGEKFIRFQSVRCKKDGSHIDASLAYSPIYDSRGNILGASAVVRDITERIAAEKARGFLAAIVESSMDAIIGITLDSHVASWNRGAQQIFGYTQEEIIGRPIRILTIAEDLPLHRRNAELIREGRSVPPFEVGCLRKDGRTFHALISASPIKDENGQPVASSCIVRDITELKAVEEHLHMAKDAAEAANRAKSEFLANMSHEIRTPMNGIIGMTDLALDTKLTAEQREYLETVRFSADSLLSVVNDILDFSKIEARKLELTKAVFNIRELVLNGVKPMRLRAIQKGLVLDCVFDASVPETAVGDPGRLRQILINLVGNAIKFTEHGSVKIHVKNVPAPEGETHLHFCVHDTGIGISPEKHTTVFEAFEQADTTATRQYGGTGLGLTIASQLTALMGGEIRVESTPGKGSTFHFDVRLESSLEQEHVLLIPGLNAGHEQRVPESQRNKTGLKILVAEDNTINARLAMRLLEKQGHRPTLVQNGQMALNAWKNDAFDLILMDLQMPDMDGFEATRTIREEEKVTGKHIPIIAMTAHAMNGDRERCLSVGMDNYVSKPINQHQLVETLESVLATPAEKRAFLDR